MSHLLESERVPPPRPTEAAGPDIEVLIIGSGFAGLCMAIQLSRRGTRFVLLERENDIGGTWRDNTYPGCACDIPSHLYSFSFEPNPEWTRTYPTQPEIWRYLKRCAEKYKLWPKIRFNTEVRSAEFNEVTSLWHVRTQTGETITARVVISGMGALSRPAYPKIPGLERFRGLAFHSAKWNHACDLHGKRAAVIGTGASAIQFVPHLASEVAKLYVIQRTPPWIVPKHDRSFRRWERFVFRHFPAIMELRRKSTYWRHELHAVGFTLNRRLMKNAERKIRKYIEASITDPTLRTKVTPDYTLGCKRVLMSNDYYPSLARTNVELITDEIAEIREQSIIMRDGTEQPVDVIIYGTGFLPVDELTPVHIIGRNGVDLDDAWRKGAEAYLGIAIAGFPNLFMLVGPNSGLAHNSMVFIIEAQVHYIMRCLQLLRDRSAATMDPYQGVQTLFNRNLQKRMQRTVWTSGCKSRYLDAYGKNTSLWPGFSFDYWMKTRQVKSQDYRFSPICHTDLTFSL